MKKYRSGVLVWLLTVMASFGLYLIIPDAFASLGKRVDDLFFIYHPHPAPSGKVVIVDIDEKSLAALGQWPWERDRVAQLLERIAQDGAGIIGLDIVFAEADKTSPSYINHREHLGLIHPRDHDSILADTLRRVPVIGGYVFDMQRSTPHATPPRIPAVIVEKYTSDPLDAPPAVFQAQGIIPNIPRLQNSFYSSGFFNNVPDASGMIRRAPLIIRYQGALYPSLDLEMIRIAMGGPPINIWHGAHGIESIQIGDRQIPVDPQASLVIRHRGPHRTFPYFSAVDVLNGTIDPRLFRDKFVLVGSSAAGLLDLRSTPLDSVIAGVEIHATILDNILTEDFLSRPVWIDGLNASIYVGGLTLAFLFFLLLDAVWLIGAAFALLVLFYAFVNWVLFDQALMINTAFPFLAWFAALVSAGLVNYFFETRQKKMIRETLAKKVSPAVAKELIRHAQSDILQNRQEEITVFFSDIRNFTSLSEKMPAPDLIRLLNRYVEPMTEIILSHRGTIDKFIGDAVMAYWNAPQHVTHHCDAAVQSALHQLDALEQLNQENRRHSLPLIQIGIGINTGTAIVGEVGSRGRSDFTVIGDSVNLAARLQDLNKTYGTKLIISENTKDGLTEKYIIRELDRTQVRGKEEIIRIYEVIGTGDPASEYQEELHTYHTALEAYFSGDYPVAQSLFSSLERTAPSTLYALHLQRTQKALENTL